MPEGMPDDAGPAGRSLAKGKAVAIASGDGGRTRVVVRLASLLNMKKMVASARRIVEVCPWPERFE